MPKANKNKSFPIVGVGASAGGLEAFTEFLKVLPIDIGMGYVLIQHLDPDHESVLTNLLGRITKLPVSEVKDSTPVEPNHVYVIPPNFDMTISEGVLKLTPRSKDGKLHLPIDHFLLSLAENQKENAIGIIFSGTASDGTQGLKAIKTEGGITFAQNETAKYQGMPKAAIASGCVDFVFSPAEIAKELSRISKHSYILKPNTSGDQPASFEGENDLKKIFYLLHKNINVDFSHYKAATVKRRILRRMLLHKLPELADYVKYLRENSGEANMLYQDILINVTSFFRDPQATQFLKDQVFPSIVKNRAQKEPIRVWVPGCATGEEAYSMAIALSEFLNDNSLNIPVQVFGTDLNELAIAKARQGMYTSSDLQGVSPRRIERFLIKTNGNYQIVKPIRDLCIFALHNVFADPPFSKLDLISCSNLLIYLDLSLQDKIFNTFYYALKSRGSLVLGKSESTGTHSELFSQIDKKYKVYVKKNTALRGAVDFSAILPQIDKKSDRITTFVNGGMPGVFNIQKEADTLLLAHFTPASVVINNDLEIIQFRGSTGPFLEPSPGKASFNLIKMAREGLGFELRSTISKVRKNGHPVKKIGIPLTINGNKSRVTLEVLPLKSFEEQLFYLVLFEETSKFANREKEELPSEQKTGHLKSRVKDSRIAELEQELAQAREDMRSVTEEQEATNEELQSASEEVLSSNEELQSINEELETSKEELESTNEELTTVNEELQNRNQQLSEAQHYAEAIIRTVQVPLLILDSDLRVKTANRSFCQMFDVTEDETEGQLVYDLGNGQWNIPALRLLLNEILPKNNSFDNYEVEHTFSSIGHKIMLLNARKFYRDGENILLAIEDISEFKQLEQRKDEFISTASHELKTPVTTIKGYTELLNRHLKTSDDEKAIRYISRMDDQINRLTQLISDLLDVTKIQAGKLVLRKEVFDMDELVKDVIEDLQHTTTKHRISFEEVGGKKLIVADKYRISQALINLMTNAINYSPKSDKIIVLTTSTQNSVVISVQDFGIGISKKDQNKVFDRFFQSQTKIRGSAGGLGLGLYITGEIVKHHGGNLQVESEKGKGSVFTISLPVKEAK